MRRLTILCAALVALAAVAAGAHGPVATGFGGGGGGGGGGASALPYRLQGTRNPYLVIDTTPVYAPAINDRVAASIPYLLSSLANSEDDAVLSSQLTPCETTGCELPFTTTSTKGSTTLNAPDDFRYMVCRNDTTPFAPCKGTASCHSTLGTTTNERNVPFVLYDASLDSYVAYAVSAATDAACGGTGTFTVTVAPALHDDITTSDSLGPAYQDGIHFSRFMARALGEFIARASYDTTYIPPREGLPGVAADVSTMEDDCATSGWTKSAASGSLAQTTDGTANHVNANLRSAVWGHACKLTGTLSSGDYMLSPAFDTVAGRTYAVRFYARVNAASTSGVVASILKSGGSAESGVYDWAYGPNKQNIVAGWVGTAEANGDGCRTTDRAGIWQICVKKFTATTSASQLKVAVNASATDLYLDEVYAFESNDTAPDANVGLFATGKSFVTFDTDSQGSSTGYANGLPDSGLLNGFARGVTLVDGASLACPMSGCGYARAGARLRGDPGVVDFTESWQRWRVKRMPTALFAFGVNDVVASFVSPAHAAFQYWSDTVPSTLNTTAARSDFVEILRMIGDAVTLPVWVTPQPYAYGTGTDTGLCSGYYCGVGANAVFTAMLHAHADDSPSDIQAAIDTIESDLQTANNAIDALPTATQLWSCLTTTSPTTEGNVQNFNSFNAGDTTTGSSGGKWVAGFAGTLKRFCVTVATPAPTGTEGCRIYLAKGGSEVSGSSVDFGSDALDALTETVCKTLSATFTATDYFQVVFGAETGATGDYCVDNVSCECAGSTLAVRTSLWVTD